MSVTSKPLFAAAYAATAQTTVYTVAEGRTIIDKFTAWNGTASPVTVTVNLAPSAGTAGAGNVVESKVMAAGEGWGFPLVVGHVLEKSATISVLAGTASAAVIRASGREVV